MAPALEVLELLALSLWLGRVFSEMLMTARLHRGLSDQMAARVRRAVVWDYCVLGLSCGLAPAGVQIARGW